MFISSVLTSELFMAVGNRFLLCPILEGFSAKGTCWRCKACIAKRGFPTSRDSWTSWIRFRNRAFLHVLFLCFDFLNIRWFHFTGCFKISQWALFVISARCLFNTATRICASQEPGMPMKNGDCPVAKPRDIKSSCKGGKWSCMKLCNASEQSFKSLRFIKLKQVSIRLSVNPRGPNENTSLMGTWSDR